MPKFDDYDDRLSIMAARSKLALLQDLFTGAGFGENLSLGERALDGLTTIFREIGAAMEPFESSVPDPVAPSHGRHSDGARH